MVEHFAPTVFDKQTGLTYQPPGWMWILAYALGGCEWAMREANSPEFRARLRTALREQRAKEIEAEIAALEKRLDIQREKLKEMLA